uniref:Uncharacterized protein n=1 Tax=Kalanchoe fedtschenkoi TaxID=63787 RepID=A0A7N0V6E4_KALFE
METLSPLSPSAALPFQSPLCRSFPSFTVLFSYARRTTPNRNVSQLPDLPSKKLRYSQLLYNHPNLHSCYY